MPSVSPESLAAIKWGVAIAVPALSGLVGVLVGAWLMGRRVVRSQLRDFYSPLLGVREEILRRSEVRVKVGQAASDAWKKICAEAREIGTDALGKVSKERGPEFEKIIEYDNVQLEKPLPSYRKLVQIFRDNYWLAEPETQSYFAALVEFVELWDRWISENLPHEVISELNHSEELLHPFYDHLKKTHMRLQSKLSSGVA